MTAYILNRLIQIRNCLLVGGLKQSPSLTFETSELGKDQLSRACVDDGIKRMLERAQRVTPCLVVQQTLGERLVLQNRDNRE